MRRRQLGRHDDNRVVTAPRSMQDERNDLEFDLSGGNPSEFLDRSKELGYPYDEYDPIVMDAYDFLDELSYEGAEQLDFDEYCFDDDY